MKIEIIKCLEDNFSYLLINEKNSDACVVDPGESKPVLKFIEDNKINLKYILNTHHHGDHIGGNNILKNKFIVKKGDVITSSILSESDLNLKSINLKIKSLLRETLDVIKLKGSQVSEIKTSGNFIKKIKDFLQENQNIKFKLEVVSLRNSKTIEPIVVEINIFKIAS